MKDIDLFSRTQYVRIFMNLIYPCIICAALTLPFIGWKSIPIFALVNVLLPFPLIYLTGKIADFLLFFYTGSYRGKSQLEHRAEAELTKAKYCKNRKRYGEALHHINSSLTLKPEYPEALMVKSHILLEGFANSGAAKCCLEKILQMEGPVDEIIREWASNELAALKDSQPQQDTQL